MYVWACVVVVERCGEGCGCVSYSRGMCGGVSMRVVGWTCTLYCEHHERYIWTRLPMDLYESMRVRMDGWNPRTLWGDRDGWMYDGRRLLSSGVERRDDDENMGDDRRRRDDRRVRGACVRVRCDA